MSVQCINGRSDFCYIVLASKEKPNLYTRIRRSSGIGVGNNRKELPAAV